MSAVIRETASGAMTRKLFALLPALYRIRDAEAGRRLGGGDQDGPLHAIIAIIAEQAAVVADDLDQLYDDQFIETCQEWVVPYIGDLVGARGLFIFKHARFSQRALVANTLGNRRRKGTAAGLEQLARDVTQWNSSVVEYFERLTTTQYMKHVRLANHMMPALRLRHRGDTPALDYLNTPFDPSARLLEVRRIQLRRGRYNIPNIGVFLWRLGAHRRSMAPPYAVDAHRFTFDPLGRSIPLVTHAEVEEDISHLAQPVNVPMPLSRRVFFRQIETFYGQDNRKSILVTVNGTAIPSAQVRVCNLSDLPSGDWAQQPGGEYLIDPELGRLMTPASLSAGADIRVTWHYGFSAEMGGGEYARAASFTAFPAPPSQVAAPGGIQAALDAIAGSGAVEVASNDYFAEPIAIRAGREQHVELRAAEHYRPTLLPSGDLVVTGDDESTVTLNGFLIAGATIRVPAFDGQGRRNRLRRLQLRHCAVPPGATPVFSLPTGTVPAQPARPRVIVEAADLVLEIHDSIVGPIRAAEGSHVVVRNSIVDAGSAVGVAFSGLLAAAPPLDEPVPGATLDVTNSTIVGKAATLAMRLASNSIFLAALADAADVWPASVIAERLQEGCVRYSYVPVASRLPRRHRCLPAVEADAARMQPVFTSLRHGDAGYGQLSVRTAIEIRTGADDQAEMGAFHDLFQPQRAGNLRARLDEYLRFGLEAGVLCVT